MPPKPYIYIKKDFFLHLSSTSKSSRLSFDEFEKVCEILDFAPKSGKKTFFYKTMAPEKSTKAIRLPNFDILYIGIPMSKRVELWWGDKETMRRGSQLFYHGTTKLIKGLNIREKDEKGTPEMYLKRFTKLCFAKYPADGKYPLGSREDVDAVGGHRKDKNYRCSPKARAWLMMDKYKDG